LGRKYPTEVLTQKSPSTAGPRTEGTTPSLSERHPSRGELFSDFKEKPYLFCRHPQLVVSETLRKQTGLPEKKMQETEKVPIRKEEGGVK